MPLRSRPGHDVEGRSRDGLVGALHLGTLGRSQFVFPVYAYRTPKKTILSKIQSESLHPGDLGDRAAVRRRDVNSAGRSRGETHDGS